MNNGDQKYVLLTEVLPKNHVNTKVCASSILWWDQQKNLVIPKIALIKTRVNRVLAVVLPNSIIKTTMCSINICSDVYLEKHSLLEYACELSMPTLYTIQISHLNDLHRNCRKSWGPR